MRKLFHVFVIAVSISLISCVDKAVEPENHLLEANYLKWKSLGINDYTIVQSQVCFCLYGGVKAIIHIRNNQILSVQDSAGVTVIKQEYWQYYKTIDQLFETVNRALFDKPNTITIEYDKVYGFPKNFFVDPIKQAADDEYGYATSSFKPLR
jgi:hypothetical protein